ncbi:prealbumin-like fold domain-containing protein [Peptostreptococcus russellii]|uniref:prealbumin-like fold domain-containing protein n=1 Tax=Peptostreptococcus russellii TaxID=215200 RepID=UPI003F58BF58
MKHKKKILSLLAALAIAIPMTIPMNTTNSSFAESVEFLKVDEDNSGNGVKGAVYDFYEINKDGMSDKKIFTVTTNDKGKLDPNSFKSVDKNYSKNVVDSDGNLNLPVGSYYIVETKAPNNYMINTSTESFSVVKDGMWMIDTSDRKFPTDHGQLIIRSSDKKSGSALPGADIELFKKDSDGKYKSIATFLSDDDGYMIPADNVEMYNGTVVLPVGEYMIKENKVEGNYNQITKNHFIKIQKGTTYRANFAHDAKGTDSGNQGNGNNGSQTTGENDNESIKDRKTGVKIRVINKKTDKPLSKQGIAVYLSSTGKQVYNGKTNSDGYLSPNDATVGKAITENNVLYLAPGKYYYKLSEYSSAKHHDFTVEKGKIGDQVLKLQVNSDGSLANSSNTKKGTSSPSSSKLAKTGFVNTKVYAFAGIALVCAGIALAAKKKKNNWK